MPPNPPKPHNAPFVLRLDAAGWDRARLKYGYRSDREAARALQIETSTLSRLRTHKHSPSGDFIASVMGAWRSEQFADLFLIVPGGEMLLASTTQE